jgi:hypothetical protein
VAGSWENSNRVRNISDQPTPVLHGGDDDDDDDDDKPASVFHIVHQDVGPNLGTTAYVTTSKGIKLLLLLSLSSSAAASSSFVN